MQNTVDKQKDAKSSVGPTTKQHSVPSKQNRSKEQQEVKGHPPHLVCVAVVPQEPQRLGK